MRWHEFEALACLIQGKGLIADAGAAAREADIHQGEKIKDSPSSSGASSSTTYTQVCKVWDQQAFLTI